jgi:hypothetical protein
MAVKITNRFDLFVTKVNQRAVTGVTKALVLGSSEASVLTPIDTSTLLNSMTLNVREDGTRIVGTVGYTAEYALPVHDPDHPQDFNRPTAEKAFLKHGFERAEPNIRAAIIKELKV